MDVEGSELTADRNGQRREAAILAIGNHIRKASGEGRLVRIPEVLSELHRLDFLSREEQEDANAESRSILEDALEKNEDLREATGKDGLPRYYSTRTMSDAYAGILFLKEEDPLTMMAEIIRENSRVYPRPIRLDAFTQPPFDLTLEGIEACLLRMENKEGYRDIVRTQTSIGTDFLYSTLHLEPDYASMLAEWYDVGQSRNP
jgi:hypothetical protein